MKNEYLFLAGAAGFSILPSILKRTGVSGTGFMPAGAAISPPSVNAAQGQIIKAVTTVKNNGTVPISIRTWLGYTGRAYISSALFSLAPGAQTTSENNLGVPTDESLGTKTLTVRVTDDLGNVIYDSSTGSVNITSGASAQIVSVTVSVV